MISERATTSFAASEWLRGTTTPTRAFSIGTGSSRMIEFSTGSEMSPRL